MDIQSLGMKKRVRIRLLALRDEHHLTQQEVAEGSGVALRAYQNYERALHELPISAAIALADFYGISLDELTGRERLT